MNKFVLKGNIGDITVDDFRTIKEKLTCLYYNLDELELWDEFVWGSSGSTSDVDYIEVDVSKDLNLFTIHTDSGGHFVVEVVHAGAVPRGIPYMTLDRDHLWFRLI